MTEFPAAVYDLPKEIRARLRDYPQSLQQLALVYYQPRLSDGYYPRIVSIYCDGQLGLQSVDDKKTFELEVEKNYWPKLIEFNFDGQMVALLLVEEDGEKEIILDRMPLGSDFYPFERQGIPHSAFGRSRNTEAEVLVFDVAELEEWGKIREGML